MRRQTGWRTAWLVIGLAPGMWWGCWSSDQPHRGAKPTTGAVSHHGHPRWINTEFIGVGCQPLKRGIAILHRNRVWIFGGDPIVDEQHRHSGFGDVARCQPVVEAAKFV